MKTGTITFSTFLRRNGRRLLESTPVNVPAVVNIAMAMLELALLDMQGKQSPNRMSALAWIHAANTPVTTAGGLSFAWCCGCLGLNQESTAAAIIALSSRKVVELSAVADNHQTLLDWFAPYLPVCTLCGDLAAFEAQIWERSALWAKYPCCGVQVDVLPAVMSQVGAPLWTWREIIVTRLRTHRLPTPKLLAWNTGLPRRVCQQMLDAFRAVERERRQISSTKGAA